ncbi:hypothetical protein BKA60DRAFT_71912 [Fusarium oxysporum]|nr:hypothetical protein BKA60DRAFT_71912 [Fusarium oxysporum]
MHKSNFPKEMLSHVSSPSSASDTCTNTVCQGSSIPKSKSSHLPALNHLPVSSYALAAERRVLQSWRPSFDPWSQFVPVDRNWKLVCKSPGTSPQRPPLTSHPGTICLFVFFYKVSRPTLPRIPEYPSLNFPRQSSLPQVEYHSPSTEGSSATKGKETCPLGMQVSLDWIGIKITPLSSSQLSSRISAIHLYCLNRHLQDAKAIQGRA